MLVACADLTRAALPSLDQEHGHNRKQQNAQTHGAGRKPGSQVAMGRDVGTRNLLQTILESSAFTSNDVFKIACSIYHEISTGSYLKTSQGEDANHQPTHPPLQVANAFLYVCAIAGHFDKASTVLEDMMGRAQGAIKPDLTTYRHVLRAAYKHRQRLRNQNAEDTSDLDVKIDQIIDHAAEALVRQARMAFWIKLGLGGLAGATVAKFTMMGVMALPSSRSIIQVDGSVGSDHSSSLSTDGIIQLLASQEIAMSVSLAAGLLTAGYFIHGSTRQPIAMAQQEPSLRTALKSTDLNTRYQRAVQDLPRAKLFGLHFPELATTNIDEIRENLRSNMRV
ncbi:hypothetical protein BGZ65_010029 [Modicella reniformis]|uniref:Uncharacterized protein n=1 Tax=Modicella reniformis TaxID=1440133 RepID=A0A9P6MKS2_9FUNG|nr:hypothetical protein BGZ65_010029 [Modicella reniformis]